MNKQFVRTLLLKLLELIKWLIKRYLNDHNSVSRMILLWRLWNLFQFLKGLIIESFFNRDDQPDDEADYEPDDEPDYEPDYEADYEPDYEADYEPDYEPDDDKFFRYIIVFMFFLLVFYHSYNDNGKRMQKEAFFKSSFFKD